MNNNNHYRPKRFSFMPPVIKNLLIINALFYLATLTLGARFNIDLIELLGLHFPGSEAFKPYQFITYMFMHSTNFNHILFNMFALWMFGSALENHWGTKRFLTYYLITGIGASLLHLVILYFEMQPTLAAIQSVIDNPSINNVQAFIDSPHYIQGSREIMERFISFQNNYNGIINTNPNEAMNIARAFMADYRALYLNLPTMVGASGAVFGILLAFGMTFPNTLIYLYFFIPVRAKYFVIFYGVAEFFFGIYDKHSNIAHFAHLGGMIFGIALILYWKQKNKRKFM